MKTNIEVWVDVIGYEGLYQVSNLGRVKSLRRTQILPASGGIRIREERFLCNQLHYKGYKTLKLSKNDKSIRFKIHRLVANAFIPNPKKYPQVNHINGIKTDNIVENLEWCTNIQNQQHAIKKGLRKLMFTDSQILDIRTDKKSLNKIADKYNCSFQLISQIKNHKSYK